jgi:NAD(P)-dependent dehydrogenase (short-subunit alcohol dehydrogenase family)
MILGVAAGVVIATTALIPRIDPPGIYLGAATLLAIFGAIEATRPGFVKREESNMTGKAVLITGVGERGQVGYALAQRFLAAGARVLITSRSDPASLAAELAPHGDIAGVAADLTVPADVERLFAAARERLGGLDALIHAAGGLRAIGPVADASEDDWRDEIERNATSTFLVIRAALPLLRERRGAVVTFASPAGERAVQSLAAYSAAKAGVIALTRAVALEEKPFGVRINAVAPGTIDTAQNRTSAADAAAFVTRDEIAEVVLFLASPASSGINGETVHVLGDTLT